MSASNPEDDLSARAESHFAAWAARLEDGESLDFESLVRAHPELEAPLRRLHEDWKLFAPLLGRVVPGLIADASGIVLPSIARDPDTDESEPEVDHALYARLGIHVPSEGRYRFRAVIGRGGGGVVLKVWDSKLNRALAMKFVLGQAEARPSGDTPKVDGRTLSRFVDEARIASQLNHPSIVPVHELGADETGRAYFTMKLVKGEDFARALSKVQTGEGGWNPVRALSVLLRVCEAMAYAHDKGVIHRDLKPANVMVGAYGEVHVMDWGLARVLGEKDTRDLRIRPQAEGGSPISAVDSFRRGEREGAPDSPLVTMDGAVIGTPSYMSPEQARGDLEAVGPRSDVYAIGAMLYHLIGGEPPYAPKGAELPQGVVLENLLHGPPRDLLKLAPQASAELVAICERAMQRESTQRYGSMLEVAKDLRAFLEGHVVSAYETGTWAETKKWVQRNKPLAASLAGASVLLACGLTVSLVLYALAKRRAVELQRAYDTILLSEQELRRLATLAQVNERLATEKAGEVLSLSATRDLKHLGDEADRLWPAYPQIIPQLEQWLVRARVLIDGRSTTQGTDAPSVPSLSDHEARLAELLKRANPPTDDQAEANRRLARQLAPVSERAVFEFDDPRDAWWCEELVELILGLKDLTDESAGGLCTLGTWQLHGWGIPKRLEFARTVEERSVIGPEARRRWVEALAAIAASPEYGGLVMGPQLGLLPIGMDPDSHLWEFAHLQTGEPTVRGADGRLLLTEESGLVFVLIPGRRFWMGAQKTDPNGRNFDPEADTSEAPVHEVELMPYFLSKYEMTQGQWLRFTGVNPSFFGPTRKLLGHQHDLRHPVESVSWSECTTVLTRLGLSLPSEAQWENACRAGSTTPWATGAVRESLRGRVNVADQSFAQEGGLQSIANDWPDMDDGWAVHAPVGTFAPNLFGLHDVHGNVQEWCLDGFDAGFYAKSNGRDPVSPSQGAALRVRRGGSFFDTASAARSASRDVDAPETSRSAVGVRPARALELARSTSGR